MAKKNSFGIKYDSPVILTFAIASFIVFALDFFVFKKDFIKEFFVCHASKVFGDYEAFNFKAFPDYPKMIFHELGSTSWHSLLTGILIIMILGPSVEEKFGSVFTGLMIFMTSLISGILTATISHYTLTGSTGVIFTFMILSLITDISKKSFSLSAFFIFVVFIAIQLLESGNEEKNFILFMQKNTGLFIEMIGGICGSLFGFMVTPKSKKAPKKKADTTILYNEKTQAEDATVAEVGGSSETIVGVL